MQVWNVRLTENTGRKKLPKIRHLRTIAQLCWAISLQLRHISTIGKKTCKTAISPPTCPRNMENFGLLAAEIVSLIWGTPANFNGFRVLAVTARHSGSGRQRNFAALKRAPPIFGRAAITLGIGLHSSLIIYWSIAKCDHLAAPSLRQASANHNHFTALFQDHPGEPVPAENFWTLWWKGRLTDLHTYHPAGRHSIRTNQCPPPPSPHFLPAGCPSCRPTVSKHWRQRVRRQQSRMNLF